MKFIAILNNLPDIIFFHADQQYAAHINDIAEKHGYPPTESKHKINLDVVLQELSPSFLSLGLLETMEFSVNSMTAPNGHVYVFRKFDEYLYIGMSSEDSEAFVTVQLLLLRDIVTLLYGPVTSMLKPSNPQLQEERWRATSKLLDTLDRLRKTEQEYLVQAVERIAINPMIRQSFVAALETALTKEKNWGVHALIFVGSKLLASFSARPNMPLKSHDCFLISLYVQAILDRMPSDGLQYIFQSEPLSRRTNSVLSMDTDPGRVFLTPRETMSPLSSGSDQASDTFESLRSTPPLARRFTFSEQDSVRRSNSKASSSNPEPEPEQYDADTSTLNSHVSPSTPSMPRPIPTPSSSSQHTHHAAFPAEAPLRDLRRDPVYLSTGNDKFSPFIMHCAEISNSFALVIISEGNSRAVAEHLGDLLRTLGSLQGMAKVLQRKDELAEKVADLKKRDYMMVWGAVVPASMPANLNGSYERLLDLDFHGRAVFEKTTKDMFMYYHTEIASWCIGEILGNFYSAYAMASDAADEPDGITQPWEVRDFDLGTFRSDPDIHVRRVRGDGALINDVGLWAKRSTNGLFYCGGKLTKCYCGECDDHCGPIDGCNCASCKKLDASHGGGNKMVWFESILDKEHLRSQALMSRTEPRVRAELENALDLLKRLVPLHASAAHFEKKINFLFDILKREHNKWESLLDHLELLARDLRTSIGEAVARQNLAGDKREEGLVAQIQEQVKKALADYVEFFSVKRHRNITMAHFLQVYPGLVHFIYVVRSKELMSAPSLAPFAEVAGEMSPCRALKMQIWQMYDMAEDIISQGYSSFSFKRGDFKYSYFLWLETADGSRLAPSVLGQGSTLSSSSNSSSSSATTHTTSTLDLPPSYPFYSELMARSLPQDKLAGADCYELHLIHLAVVPPEYVLSQASRLLSYIRSTPDFN